MLNKKIVIFPDIQSLVSAAPKPLIFWKKIKKNSDKELHLALLAEGRTDQETFQLGKELWEMISTYENELVINKNGLSNPEFVCESILKIANEYLTNFCHRTRVDNWSELGIVILVANGSGLYFARVGRPRLILFRENQIILADENLSHPRSPQFSPPFSELAGGLINMGDRILLLSGTITERFSWEEVYSLAAHPNTSQAFLNVVKSIEVLNPSINSAFIFGDVVAANTGEEVFTGLLKTKLKENRVGDLYFQEFDPTFREVAGASTTFFPWREILSATVVTALSAFRAIGRIIGFPLKPLGQKIGALSSTRKAILGAFVIIILALGILIFRSTSKPTAENSGPAADFQALYDKAGQLQKDANDALIYQDEEKARKSLAQADNLLEQASQSSDVGIKALKLKQEVDDQLAGLDKAQNSQSSKIWSTPDSQEQIKRLGLESNENVLVLTSKSGYEIKPADTSAAQNFSGEAVSGSFGWLVPTQSDDLYLAPKDRNYSAINLTARTISEKKSLPTEVNSSVSAAGSYQSFVYFFDPAENQIKQFTYDSSNLTFKADWLKQDLKDVLNNNPAESMAIDGSIFLVTENGTLLKLSGGKKASWDAEKPGTGFKGDKLILQTKPDDKNLYLLDPDNQRIAVFEKETGKLKGQLENSALTKTVDFQVSEKEKTIYFATPNDLFKLSFTP